MPRHVNHLRWKIVAFLLAPLTFVMTLDRAAMAVTAIIWNALIGDSSIVLRIFALTSKILHKVV